MGMLNWEMIKRLVLLLAFSGEDSGKLGPLMGLATCENYSGKTLLAIEGEDLRIKPDCLKDSQHLLFTWRVHRQQGDTSFSSEEEERIHHHGPDLYFLPVSVNDTGLYIAQFNLHGKCHSCSIPVEVMLETAAYIPIVTSESNVQLPCPERVADLCKDLNGSLRWYRNSSAIEGVHPVLRLNTATRENHNGFYTCNCTWRHKEKERYSTASRELKIKGKTSEVTIRFTQPATGELLVHPGFQVKIKCEAYFGTNLGSECCSVTWEKDNQSTDGMEGYHQDASSHDKERRSEASFFSSTLIIEKVQQSDLHASFRCRAKTLSATEFRYISLKPAASLTCLVVTLLCISSAFLLAGTAIKYFKVDLVLFSRRFPQCTEARNDGSQYDVYVLYNSQKETKAIEEVLSKFLSRALPLVLEQRCGYRVFIHGRDDIPGEDFLKQVEVRVTQSRRLMVVLTPGSEVNEMLHSSPGSPAGDDVNWQVGLYHALVQEIKVILVQLGDMGPQGYTHLSPTLQHLIRKCAPLYWREDLPGATHWNSRFWKRVRYAMPTASAKHSSSVV